MIWDGMSSVEANTTPSFLSHGLDSVFSCLLQKTTQVRPAHSWCQGTSTPQTAAQCRGIGSAGNELIGVPLPMSQQLRKPLCRTGFLAGFNADNSISMVTEVSCLRPGTCWFKHRTHLPPKHLKQDQRQQVATQRWAGWAHRNQLEMCTSLVLAGNPCCR